MPGALNICGAMGMCKIVVLQNMVIGLVQVRLIFHFLCHGPHSRSELGHVCLTKYSLVATTLLTFNAISSIFDTLYY